MSKKVVYEMQYAKSDRMSYYTGLDSAACMAASFSGNSDLQSSARTHHIDLPHGAKL